jgi:hypothetical protein
VRRARRTEPGRQRRKRGPLQSDTIAVDFSVSIAGAFGKSFAKPVDITHVPAVRDAVAGAVADFIAVAVDEYIASRPELAAAVRRSIAATETGRRREARAQQEAGLHRH